jgi:hypothetical protein
MKNTPIKNVRMLAVKWNNVVIGYLMKEEGVGYLFKYDTVGMSEAKEQGYNGLIGFPNLRKIYISEQMPQPFASRIPSKQRRNLNEILKENGMEDYDQMEYLSRTGGKLQTDSISFENFDPKSKNNRTKRLSVAANNKRGNNGREFE